MEFNFQLATEVINAVTLLLFTALLGSGLFGILRRVILYKRAKVRVPVIMRRDIALLGSLALIGLESMLLRALNVDLQANPPLRLAFVAHWDIVLVLGLGYWVKIELWDVDDPDKR
jgi:hypothetical protein